ncbi:MAG: cell wall hydrolase [Deltaproteobacteria bacterium]|nr:cell wall hydrolase [Deltaproteobacteria bacterium]
MNTPVAQALTFAQIVAAIASPAFHDGIGYMADAMTGEQGDLFPSEQQTEIGQWIGHVILNRLDDPRWTGTVREIVQSGFYGHAKANDHPYLQGRMANVAIGVIVDRAYGGQDVTGGCYWMYSLHDLQRWPGYRFRASKCWVSGEYGLCFFKEPPPS